MLQEPTRKLRSDSLDPSGLVWKLPAPELHLPAVSCHNNLRLVLCLYLILRILYLVLIMKQNMILCCVVPSEFSTQRKVVSGKSRIRICKIAYFIVCLGLTYSVFLYWKEKLFLLYFDQNLYFKYFSMQTFIRSTSGDMKK